MSESLEEIFGRSSILKVLDVLMSHPSMDYSKKEIAGAAGIAESSVHRNWKDIEKLDAVKETRKFGKTQLYRLNQESGIVKNLYRIEEELKEDKEAKVQM
ncbi:MAG: hypothetical protein ABEJ03_00800 [Candidatus Nanohaloarchaea archaeon]